MAHYKEGLKIQFPDIKKKWEQCQTTNFNSGLNSDDFKDVVLPEMKTKGNRYRESYHTGDLKEQRK